MKQVAPTTLLLLIFGITFVGCHTTINHEIRRELDSGSPIGKYTGPQTVEALMAAFDARYSSRAANAKWSGAIETSYGEKRNIEFTLVDMDAKYPRDKWLQMLLNKGVTIENFKDYDGYFNIRSDLILKEFYTEGDWETVSKTHIDAEIAKQQRKQTLVGEAKQVNPETKDWFVIGENMLPKIPGRIYLQKTESGHRTLYTKNSTTTTSENGEVISVKSPDLFEEQMSDLLNKGVEPEGWEVVYLDEKGNRIPQDK